MKIVFLVTWKADSDPAAIDEFVRTIPDVLAQGPFTSWEHGVGLKLSKGGATQADWGFILELDRDDLERWRASDAHQELGRRLRPLSGGGVSFEF